MSVNGPRGIRYFKRFPFLRLFSSKFKSGCKLFNCCASFFSNPDITVRFFFAQWFKFSHRLVRFLLTYLLTYFTCLHIYLFIDLFIYLEYAHCRRRATRRFPADTGLERAIDRRTARPLRERWPPSRVDSEFEREKKRERATYVLRFHAATSASSPARAPPQRHC